MAPVPTATVTRHFTATTNPASFIGLRNASSRENDPTRGPSAPDCFRLAGAQSFSIICKAPDVETVFFAGLP